MRIKLLAGDEEGRRVGVMPMRENIFPASNGSISDSVGFQRNAHRHFENNKTMISDEEKGKRRSESHRCRPYVSEVVESNKIQSMLTSRQRRNIQRDGILCSGKVDKRIVPIIKRSINNITISDFVRGSLTIRTRPRSSGGSARILLNLSYLQCWGRSVYIKTKRIMSHIACPFNISINITNGAISCLVNDFCKKICFWIDGRTNGINVRSSQICFGIRVVIVFCCFLSLGQEKLSAQSNLDFVNVAENTTGYQTNYEIEYAIKQIDEFAVKLGTSPDALEAMDYKMGAALKKIANSGEVAIPIIEKFVFDKKTDWKTKVELCELLSLIKSKKSVEIASNLLKDSKENEIVRAFAGSVIAELQFKETDKLIQETVESEKIPMNIRVKIMQRLGSVGYDNVEWLKKVALGEIFPKEKMSLNMDEGAGIMWNAMRALGMSKKPKATDILVELQEKFPTNDILTEALHNRKDPKTIPILIKVLERNEKPKKTTAREEAAITLGELKAIEAVEILIKIVENDSDPLLVCRSVEALSRIGDKRAMSTLEKLGKNISNDKRFQLEESLVILIENAIVEFKEKL